MERLPEWGFRQQEVSCIFEGKKPRTMWMIDEHVNNLCKNIFFNRLKQLTFD